MSAGCFLLGEERSGPGAPIEGEEVKTSSSDHNLEPSYPAQPDIERHCDQSRGEQVSSLVASRRYQRIAATAAPADAGDHHRGGPRADHAENRRLGAGDSKKLQSFRCRNSRSYFGEEVGYVPVDQFLGLDRLCPCEETKRTVPQISFFTTPPGGMFFFYSDISGQSVNSKPQNLPAGRFCGLTILRILRSILGLVRTHFAAAGGEEAPTKNERLRRAH
ncbi:hypothetical protein EPN83_03235 [Patescibacteria group bacterium]|nr:MAG: hypothetical protein EPN83_03235 [Patescibacteria group bacterium]